MDLIREFLELVVWMPEQIGLRCDLILELVRRVELIPEYAALRNRMTVPLDKNSFCRSNDIYINSKAKVQIISGNFLEKN